MERKYFENPWVTPKIRKLLQLKSEIFKLYKNHIINKETNNKIKNKIKSIVDQSKLIYYKQRFLKNKNNINKTWRTIKELLVSNTNKNSCKKIISDNIEYINNNEIAEIFNDYFSEIAISLDNNLPDSTIDPLLYVKTNSISSLYLSPTTAAECTNIISGLKMTKTDKDTVPVELLKLVKNTIAPILSKIINLSFKLGIFPSALKCGIITPILKAGRPTIKENYRPITILLIISKIFERCIYNRSVDFFSKFKILSEHQFGFQKGVSTESAIISLTEYLYEALNNKKYTLSIFIDFRRAFDTVNHAILCKKLEACGIRGSSLRLFENYLKNRTQKVKISDCLSSPRTINVGLPQGSCLGPLLFLIYVNDLPNISNETFSVLYADDTTLSLQNDSLLELITKANAELRTFHDWSTSNRLTINTEKTYTLTITNRRLPDIVPDVTLNNAIIPSLSSGKLLGVTLDNKLNF